MSAPVHLTFAARRHLGSSANVQRQLPYRSARADGLNRRK